MIENLQLVTAPVLEPITLLETKRHLRVTHTEDDVQIHGLVRAARRWAANYQGRSYVNTTWDWFLDDFPGVRRIQTPMPPLSSVTSVKYQDTDDATQTFSAGDYQVITRTDAHGFIDLDFDANWPTVYDKADAVVIRFVAGYGSEPHSVPHQFRQAMLMHVEAHYDRDPATMAMLIEAGKNLLHQQRVLEVV